MLNMSVVNSERGFVTYGIPKTNVGGSFKEAFYENPSFILIAFKSGKN